MADNQLTRAAYVVDADGHEVRGSRRDATGMNWRERQDMEHELRRLMGEGCEVIWEG